MNALEVSTHMGSNATPCAVVPHIGFPRFCWNCRDMPNAIRLELARSLSMLNATRLTQTMSGCPGGVYKLADAAPKTSGGRPRAAPGRSAQPDRIDRSKGGRRALPKVIRSA